MCVCVCVCVCVCARARARASVRYVRSLEWVLKVFVIYVRYCYCGGGFVCRIFACVLLCVRESLVQPMYGALSLILALL